MASVRPAAVAGVFYPADPGGLRDQVHALLASAPPTPVALQTRMVIVPHAGYIYSGAVAAAAYRLLIPTEHSPARVLIIGPSHFVRFAGLATPGAAALQTPLGLVPIDEELTGRAEAHEIVAALPEVHSREHSLEVQLPFLQVAVDDFAATALATGDVAAHEVAEVLDDLMIPGATGVISSDLSHYLDHEAARIQDARTATAIENLQAAEIGRQDACGRTAVQAALMLAAARGWKCRRVALANSGDTAGTRDRVVGYGAFAIGPLS